MKIAVLDYGIGNLRSAQKALESLGADAQLTTSTVEVEAADAVILPGVGAFGAAMNALRDAGLADVALEAAVSDTPFFGICVGMQMLYSGSDESPGVDGLGVFDGTVRRLPEGVLHPQMQWNLLRPVVAGEPVVSGEPAPHPLFNNIDEPWVYFVHSYAAELGPEVIATCDYGGDVNAAVATESLWATQFHPEKSGDVGLQILANFIDWAKGTN